MIVSLYCHLIKLCCFLIVLLSYYINIPGRYLITTMHQCGTYPDTPPPLPHFNVGNGSGSASSRDLKTTILVKTGCRNVCAPTLKEGVRGAGASHIVSEMVVIKYRPGMQKTCFSIDLRTRVVTA